MPRSDALLGNAIILSVERFAQYLCVRSGLTRRTAPSRVQIYVCHESYQERPGAPSIWQLLQRRETFARKKDTPKQGGIDANQWCQENTSVAASPGREGTQPKLSPRLLAFLPSWLLGNFCVRSSPIAERFWSRGPAPGLPTETVSGPVNRPAAL